MLILLSIVSCRDVFFFFSERDAAPLGGLQEIWHDVIESGPDTSQSTPQELLLKSAKLGKEGKTIKPLKLYKAYKNSQEIFFFFRYCVLPLMLSITQH